jgi:hypothetical protein
MTCPSRTTVNPEMNVGSILGNVAEPEEANPSAETAERLEKAYASGTAPH